MVRFWWYIGDDAACCVIMARTSSVVFGVDVLSVPRASLVVLGSNPSRPVDYFWGGAMASWGHSLVYSRVDY